MQFRNHLFTNWLCYPSISFYIWGICLAECTWIKWNIIIMKAGLFLVVGCSTEWSITELCFVFVFLTAVMWQLISHSSHRMICKIFYNIKVKKWWLAAAEKKKKFSKYNLAIIVKQMSAMKCLDCIEVIKWPHCMCFIKTAILGIVIWFTFYILLLGMV